MGCVRKYHLMIISACLILVFLSAVSVAADDLTDLKKITSGMEDPRIDANDLAFFLASHNFDAVPRDGYVEVRIDGRILKLVPNGDRPGLCDMVD